MKTIVFVILFFSLHGFSFSQQGSSNQAVLNIANGKMPQVATHKNSVHIVYGAGDSIMYTSSVNKGKSFAKPSLVAVLPGLFAFAMRGPQIVVTANEVLITACTNKGNIYAYRMNNTGSWSNPVKVNDVDEIAKEALMNLSADGSNVFAVWLGVKNPKGQSIYGAQSADGGKMWSNNVLVYSSPDSTVCECCKPSVVVNGNNVFVMFRNWLNGNRDLYLSTSSSGGKTFSQAQKLGKGNWQLNGCPMDGGGLTVNKDGVPQTVWRRQQKIYSAIPGMPENEIGEGKMCSVENVDNKNIFTWVNDGNIIISNGQGQNKRLSKGIQPAIKALDSRHIICVWENDKQIQASVISI